MDDIEQRCLAADHERFGPGDHKIWYTSQITTSSVGRGESVPIGLIPPPVLEGINVLAGKLGYVLIDENWGTAGTPGELRADVPVTAITGSGTNGSAQAGVAGLLADRLRGGLARIDTASAERWADGQADGCIVAVRSPGGRDETYWQVDLVGRRLLDGNPDTEGDDTPDWSVVGSPRAWEAVLSGERNLSSALRACELRYCDTGDATPATSGARIAMLSELLGLTPWRVTDERIAGYDATGAMSALANR